MGANVIGVRDMSAEEAARMIDRFISKKPGAHFISELAEKLGIELRVAFEAAKMLVDEGSAVVSKR